MAWFDASLRGENGVKNPDAPAARVSAPMAASVDLPMTVPLCISQVQAKHLAPTRYLVRIYIRQDRVFKTCGGMFISELDDGFIAVSHF